MRVVRAQMRAVTLVGVIATELPQPAPCPAQRTAANAHGVPPAGAACNCVGR